MYLLLYSSYEEHGTFKGQLISECLFWYLQISQKTNKTIQLCHYDISSWIVFVHFLGQLKTPKRHIEINRPLASGAKFLLSSTINRNKTVCLIWTIE